MSSSLQKSVAAKIASLAEAFSFEAPEPLPCDRWIAASTLQKAIRRGEIVTAHRAIATMMENDRRVIWRRLALSAFEDIGVAATESVVMVAALASDAELRRSIGGDLKSACLTASILCKAPKDRSADHLFIAAYDHPEADALQSKIGGLFMMDRFKILTDRRNSILSRAIAAWYASGVQRWREARLSGGDLQGLMTTYREMGVAEDLANASLQTGRRQGEPMAIMLPLIAAELSCSSEASELIRNDIATSTQVEGVPAYALGAHTRLGKVAVDRLIETTPKLQAILDGRISDKHWRKLLDMAVWVLEGSVMDCQLRWQSKEAIEALGNETEFARLHLSLKDGLELTERVRPFMDRLDAIRTVLLEEHVSEYHNANRDLFGGLE